jgi:hypothetical protein
MAISKNLTLVDNFGTEVTFPSAYINVKRVTASKSGSNFSIAMYKEKDGYLLQEKEFIFDCSFLNTAGNPLQQAYNHLKTLPEFAGAGDC